MDPKSIALIDPVGGKAGMDFYNYMLLESLAEKGYKPVLFSNKVIPAKGVQSYTSFNNIGVPKALAVFNNFVYFINALLFCRKHQVSWLFLHLFRGGLFDLVTIGISRMMGFRIILIVHDVTSLDTISIPLSRKIILTHFNHSKVVHNRFSFQELGKLISSQAMGNVHIIPHGNFTRLEEQAPASFNSIPGFEPVKGKRYILFFGQLKKIKGLDVLLKAMILSRSPFNLVAAGRTRDIGYSDYKPLLNHEFLRDRVSILNRFITNEERDFLFRRCEVVVIPYTHIFQSAVMLLAMSYKKPIIASDLEPNLELIVHKHNGLLFRNGDFKQLAEILTRVYEDTYDLESLGEEAVKSVKKFNNWLTIRDLYINILKT